MPISVATSLETVVCDRTNASRVGGLESQSGRGAIVKPACARTGESAVRTAVFPALSLADSCRTDHAPQSTLPGSTTSPSQRPDSAFSAQVNPMSAEPDGL